MQDEVVFTLDVGSGTQDFMLFAEENIRNCPKAILPSPTRLLARKIERIDGDVYLHGYTMGGGPIKFAVRKHLERYRVFADERAALTFSDNLDRVRDMGVIIGEPDGKAIPIKTGDVDMPFFADFLSKIGYELPSKYIVGVQDHGYSPYESNRVFRFRMFERMLRKSPGIENFLFHFTEIPREFNRMVDAAKCILDYMEAEVYVVDTVFAAIAGCAMSAKKFPALLANFGNSHVTAAVVDENFEIKSLLEHHTSVLRRKGRGYIKTLFEEFVRGKITNDYVLNDGGHGCFVGEVVEVRDSVCTGPNAELSDIREVEGDPMIVGNLGMMLLMERKG